MPWRGSGNAAPARSSTTCSRSAWNHSTVRRWKPRHMTDSELVVVRTFLNRFEAEMAQSALEAAEIESLIRADDAGGLRPAMTMGSNVELVVRAEDAARAEEILTSTPT